MPAHSRDPMRAARPILSNRLVLLLPRPNCRRQSCASASTPTSTVHQCRVLPKHGSRTAIGIDGSIHPGIAMISADDPFVRKFVTADFADYVPNCAVLIILLEVHFYFCRPR